MLLLLAVAASSPGIAPRMPTAARRARSPAGRPPGKNLAMKLHPAQMMPVKAGSRGQSLVLVRRRLQRRMPLKQKSLAVAGFSIAAGAGLVHRTVQHTMMGVHEQRMMDTQAMQLLRPA